VSSIDPCTVEALTIAAVALAGFIIGAIWVLVSHGTDRGGLRRAAALCRYAATHPQAMVEHPAALCIHLADALEKEAGK
jgi:hypothetical protein